MKYEDIRIGEKYIFQEIVLENDDETVDDELKKLVGSMVTVTKISAKCKNSCCISIAEFGQQLRPAELRPYSEWDI
jgi:hypothetical protein